MQNIICLNLNKSYNMLQNLKHILGFDKNIETNLNIVFNKLKTTNEKEGFLITCLVEQIFNLPPAIKKQYSLLKKYLNNKEKYEKQLYKIKYLYETDRTFIDLRKNIYKELELRYISERYYFNSVIFEIAYDYINPNIKLNLKNAILNLHFLFFWLNDNKDKQILCLKEEEKHLIALVLSGNNKEDIMKMEHLNQINNEYFLEAEMHQIIPAKFQVDNLTQALAKYYYFLLIELKKLS